MSEDLIFQCLCQDGNGFERLKGMNTIKMQMFMLFLSLSTHRFKWNGLPKELPAWCLEKVVNLYGQGVVFKVGDEYVCTSAVNSSMLNVYGEPCQVQPVAINGVSFPVKTVKKTMFVTGEVIKTQEQDAVLIKNNIYSIPTYALIKPYVEKLCFIWESMGINAGLSRIVALIHCNKDLSGAIKSEIGKIMGGTRNGLAIVNEKSNVLDKIEKLDLKVEYTPDKFWLDFDNTFNKICELIGITTDMNKAKKERVVVAQVESNDELTTIVEDSYLEHRKIACDEMKELFGLNVTVENKVGSEKVTNPNDGSKPDKNTPPQE